MNNNLKKLYVIVEYDIRNENYAEYAVDEIIFEDKKTAIDYMYTKPNYYKMSVEELTLYPEN